VLPPHREINENEILLLTGRPFGSLPYPTWYSVSAYGSIAIGSFWLSYGLKL